MHAPVILGYFSVPFKNVKTRLRSCGCESVRKSGFKLVAGDSPNEFNLTILLHIAPHESKQFNSVWNHNVQYCTEYASRKNDV